MENVNLYTQKGFTLIELVMVIVIIAILSAVAVPKFINLKGDAQMAALQGIAGSLSSASSINYGACQIKGETSCHTVASCADAATLLSTPIDSTVYTISGTLPSCTISDNNNHSTTFQGAAATAAQ